MYGTGCGQWKVWIGWLPDFFELGKRGWLLLLLLPRGWRCFVSGRYVEALAGHIDFEDDKV